MYKLEDKEFDFKRVTTQDALKVKSAMMILANDKSSIENIEQANNVIDSLAIKYLKIKDNKYKLRLVHRSENLLPPMVFINDF